jgi:hypothetical protein
MQGYTISRSHRLVAPSRRDIIIHRNDNDKWRAAVKRPGMLNPSTNINILKQFAGVLLSGDDGFEEDPDSDSESVSDNESDDESDGESDGGGGDELNIADISVPVEAIDEEDMCSSDGEPSISAPADRMMGKPPSLKPPQSKSATTSRAPTNTKTTDPDYVPKDQLVSVRSILCYVQI